MENISLLYLSLQLQFLALQVSCILAIGCHSTEQHLLFDRIIADVILKNFFRFTKYFKQKAEELRRMKGVDSSDVPASLSANDDISAHYL